LNNPTSLLPAVPPQMPQVKPNAFLRWLARCTLRMGGWKVTGTLPDIPRLVFIIAPHSSNWDGLWGMAAKIALGMKVKVLGKASLFWWPLGPLLHKLGVIPLDRSSPQGTVGQAVDLLRNNEKMWFAITPEGTRKAVKDWKAGFLKIARMADVPILAAYFHYPEKTIGIGRCSRRPATMCRHGRHPRVLPAVDRQDPRHGLSRRPPHRRHVRHMPGERDRSRVEGWYPYRLPKERFTCRVP
jgi:1-acyl-sn-glycerol-3-phosphate acyltransferase